MSTIRFAMPTKGNKLVEWEECVIAHRAKEKAEWEEKKANREAKQP